MDDQFKSVPVLPSEITPRSLYEHRRDFLKAAGIMTGGALLAACVPSSSGTAANEKVPASAAAFAGKTDELLRELESKVG